MKKLIILISLNMMGIPFSCTSPTEITVSWKNPEKQSERYSNIMVAALKENISAKATVENDLSQELREEGIHASKSIEVSHLILPKV